MRYQINKTNYHNFKVIHENKLPHRSYFISFSSEKALENVSFLEEREKSDSTLLLSGDWDFSYYKHSSQLPKEIDTDKMSFDKIHVPSTWQKTGYDKINYLNSMYPFACNPPRIPKNCPVGVYRKKFNMDKNQENSYIITFLGVSSSIDVYVNGKYVGYGEGSHNSREFDVTSFLQKGENELVAVVYKWSNGTYLECQDMFRENGIFRDVYINCMPKSYIYDFELKKEKSDKNYNVSISTKINGDKSLTLSATLKLDGEIIVKETVKADEEIQWKNLDVKEWNAETPVCYDLILSLFDGTNEIQCIRQKVGFCTIKIDGYRYLFNDKLIKLKGVNHHDTHPIRGYAMTVQDLQKDIELMKAYNVNCVRTSHYPSDPIMMTMCDVYGIYVVDEADIETHGCFVKNIDMISNDPKWKLHYLDRVEALFERDKNHACVVMWSMGNEAGGISNFDACNDYLKTKSTIPVHYEPACRNKRIRYDIMANFYTPPEEMRGICLGEKEEKSYYDAPFFLCEYAHSMGVGPGRLGEYWDVIYSHDRFLGGCIWEWADHSHYDENAKYKYTYGGDHKDKRNSGNFCCDGLFFPDRTPSPSALCMKNVYSPLRVSYKDSKVFIRNTNYFSTSENIKVKYYLLRNGVKENICQLDTVIEPQQNIEIPLNFEILDSDDAFLIFEYTYIKTGEEIAKEQIVLNESILTSDVLREDLPWNVSDNKTKLVNGKSEISFDKSGNLVSIVDKNGQQILADNGKGFTPNLWQSVIDNHVYVAKYAKKMGVNNLSVAKQKGKFDRFKNTMTTKAYLTANGQKRFIAEIHQKAISSTAMYVKFNLTSMAEKPIDMLQIGLNLNLNSKYENIRYYGMGETESYSDFYEQDVMGIYETKVSDMLVPYIKPQECGNRNKVRWVEITDSKGNGIRITALDKALDFKAVDVDNKNIRKARHIEDIKHIDSTILHINGFVRGIGSESCGPDTTAICKKFLCKGETYSYTFKVEII